MTFEEEYRKILLESGITPDEKFFPWSFIFRSFGAKKGTLHRPPAGAGGYSYLALSEPRSP
jgi:hypothetical protein